MKKKVILNVNQEKAATESLDKNLIIIAPPGSGKTLTLTMRILNILNKGTKPSQILAATFSKKAAIDLEKRLKSLLPPYYSLSGMSIGTFHHCALKILRANAKKAGTSWDFEIVSDKSQASILESAISDFLQSNSYDSLLKHPIKTLTEDNLSSFINPNTSTSNLLPPGAFNYISSVIFSAKLEDSCFQSLYPEFLLLFNMYNKQLKLKKKIDLADILFLTVNLLKQHKDVAEKYQKLFKYILVDEFQDTNTKQFELLELLGKKAVVTVCGDDDQAIYGWRGASSHVFDRFLESFPESISIILDQNYRSTQSIVEISKNLIGNNNKRIEKHVMAINSQGIYPEIIITESYQKESMLVCSIIESYVSQGYKYSDIAILYRLHKVSSDLITEIYAKNIPIHTQKKQVFFNNNESGVLSYLRLLLDSNDDEAFLTACNFPKRKLGEVAQKRIIYISTYKKTSLLESLFYLVNSSKTPNPAFSELYEIINTLRRMLEKSSAHDLAMFLIKKYKIKKCEHLIKYLGDYFLEGLEGLDELFTDIDCLEKDNKLSLSTIHQAKGREWEIVILVRVNEGVLPSGDNIEEERRLAYVAVTRAKKHLLITSVINREITNCMPSRFLEELLRFNVKRKLAL